MFVSSTELKTDARRSERRYIFRLAGGAPALQRDFIEVGQRRVLRPQNTGKALAIRPNQK